MLAQHLQRWPNIKHGMHSSLAVETAWNMWRVAYDNVVYVPADKRNWTNAGLKLPQRRMQ